MKGWILSVFCQEQLTDQEELACKFQKNVDFLI